MICQNRYKLFVYNKKTNWEEKMLYKNKIKVQNILKSAVALMLMLTLSLSTVLSPLAKAEEAETRGRL